MQRIRRALIDLRRGEPVHVAGEAGGSLILALENLTEARLEQALGLASGTPSVLLTAHRAEALGLDGHAGDGIAVAVPKASLMETARALAKGRDAEPTGTTARPVTDGERQALELARRATLLPALLAIESDPDRDRLAGEIQRGEVLSIDRGEARRFFADSGRHPERVSEARVPLSGAEQSRFILYREADGLLEHVALVIGDPRQWPTTPALRMHSACLTGDLFGSLRCDCGEQLRSAVHAIAEEGGGILLYLAQEGRGIGLANKLRAYGLQDTGLDTVDADQLLGFGEDERRYDVAAAMLDDLGISRVRLMTNNPGKIAALEAAGVEIAGREAIHGELNRHNAPYLTAKANRAGHWLEEVFADSAADGNQR